MRAAGGSEAGSGAERTHNYELGMPKHTDEVKNLGLSL